MISIRTARALRRAAWGIALAGAAAGVSFADPGDLDPAFDGDGRARVALSRHDDEAYGVAVLPDGGIVTLGRAWRAGERDLVVARFLPDGAPDSGFGIGGKVVFGAKRKTEGGGAIALQPDGKIVLATQIEKGANTARMLVARLLPDGRFDPSFGTKGRVTTAFDGTYLSPAALLVTGDGRIIVGGTGFVGGLSTSIARAWIVAAYRADGRLDRSFGRKGRAALPIGGDLQALAVQPDGRIVAGGSSGTAVVHFAVARLHPDGRLDGAFGATGTGIVETSFGSGNDYAQDLAIDGDGRIVAAGRTWSTATPDVALARYLPDGSLDPSFGEGGRVTTDIGGRTNEAYALVAGGDGRLLVAGHAILPGGARFALVRYLEDGSPDAAFGENGVVTTRIGPSSSIVVDAAFQGTDRVIAAGYAYSAKGRSDTALARYEW